MKRFDVYLVTGNIGTGKTSAGHKLAQAFQVPLLDPDLKRRELGFKDYNPKDTPVVMGEIFNAQIAAIYRGEPVIMATPYVRRRAREQSYNFINDLSIELGRELMGILINCECDPEIAKSRIRERPPKDELHCPTNDTGSWDKFQALTDPISQNEIDDNCHFSFLRYDTGINRLERLTIRGGMEESAQEVEEILLR